MHALHYIAVEAETEEEAVLEAESALSHYGEGQCWDWYEVGGRWDGVFKDAGSFDNLLRYEENPEAFMKVLSGVEKGQDEDFVDAMNKILGRSVHETEVNDFMLGIPVSDKSGAAQRISESNKACGELWSQLMGMDKLPVDGRYGMLGYHLKCLGDLLNGGYTFSSHFLDALEFTARPSVTRQRCEENPTKQWLVAVDLHN